MKDDELITTLRLFGKFDPDQGLAADRIEELSANLAKAIGALRLVSDACDEGQMVSLGTGGMTINAQIRRSVYNKVPAWPIKEARVALEELEKPE